MQFFINFKKLILIFLLGSKIKLRDLSNKFPSDLIINFLPSSIELIFAAIFPNHFKIE